MQKYTAILQGRNHELLVAVQCTKATITTQMSTADM